MKDKILTIVIPTYNMEKYLDKCLTSLILDNSELMKRLEVLVVIDGAKDRSSEIAHTYQYNYPETFRVIDKENGNYGSCVNRGLKEASGKYIKILDADDWFYTKSFSSFIQYLQSCNTDLVMNAFNCVSASDEVLSKWKIKVDEGHKLSFSDLNAYEIHMHSFTYKLDLFNSINYKQTEGISYTDTEWIFYPCVNVRSISYFSKPLYAYLIGREGQTVDTKTVAERIDQLICIVEKMIVFYIEEYKGIEYKNSQIYLLKILRRTCSFIYYVILVDNKGLVNKGCLIDFDKSLNKLYPELYSFFDSVKIHPRIDYLYIKEWRNNYKTSVPLDILEKLSQMVYKNNNSILGWIKVLLRKLLYL